jgi:hypothetical protein
MDQGPLWLTTENPAIVFENTAQRSRNQIFLEQ